VVEIGDKIVLSPWRDRKDFLCFAKQNLKITWLCNSQTRHKLLCSQAGSKSEPST